MDLDAIDWKKAGIILRMLKYNLPDALEEKMSQYKAEDNQEMIQAVNNLLNRYQGWMVKNFETPEMDIALRLMFDECVESNEIEEGLSVNDEFVKKVFETFV